MRLSIRLASTDCLAIGMPITRFRRNIETTRSLLASTSMHHPTCGGFRGAGCSPHLRTFIRRSLTNGSGSVI